MVARSRHREHITPVLADLHWLPVKSSIQYKIILIVFKILNDLAPAYLASLVTPYQPNRALRSGSANLLKTQKDKTDSVRWQKSQMLVFGMHSLVTY